ncbi:MAG: DUF502 domain-containing protein [Cytophagales bacterium]|nr:DUF502 domain-containing protein [Cytophagales bacterium]MDW8383803.1 DUF502 domain-containing protein [Flammeovirgaceae bacterium]
MQRLKLFFHKTLRWFLQGCVYIVPIVATFYIIYHALIWLDNLIPTSFFGTGILIVFSAITLIGYLTSTFITRSLFEILEQAISKLPLVRLIYTSVKDLLTAVVGDKRKFSEPVLICVNSENNLYRLGFITKQDLSHLGLQDMVGVYIPHSYNFSGNFYLVERRHIKKLPISVSTTEIMKMIVSGGVSGEETPIQK